MLTKIILLLSSLTLSLNADELKPITQPLPEVLTINSNNQNADFSDFLQCFETTVLPVQLSPESIQLKIDSYRALTQKNTQSNNRYKRGKNSDQLLFQQFLPLARFTRFGQRHITPLYVYQSSKAVKAVLYAAGRYYDRSNHYELSIATFDSEGELVSNRDLLFNNLKQQLTLDIDKTGNLNVNGILRGSKKLVGTIPGKEIAKEYVITQNGDITMSHDSKRKSRTAFSEFLAEFKKTKLPYKWDKDGKSNYHGRNFLVQNYLDEAFKNNRLSFSRVGPPRYSPIEYFELEDEVVAVLYSDASRYSPNNVSLAMFDVDGQPIQHQLKKRKHSQYQLSVASSSSKHHNTFEIDEHGVVKVSHYEYLFNEESGNNKKIGEKLKEVNNYQLPYVPNTKPAKAKKPLNPSSQRV